MSMAHVGTLLTDVDVIKGPLILLSIVVLDPTEACGTGPECRENTRTLTHTHTKFNFNLFVIVCNVGTFLS